MFKQRHLSLFLPVLLFCAAWIGCSRVPSAWPDMPGKKKVLASFAPIYCFAKAVAGDDANVLCLMTAAGPHANDLSYNDILKVRGADVIFINGLELDEVLIENQLGKQHGKKIPVVKLGDAVPEDKLHHLEEEHEKGKEEKGHHHHHGDHDPHVWLDPVLAKIMVDKIAAELSKLEPSAKAGFQKRAEVFKGKLDELHQHGLAEFKHKKNRNLVAQHDSLGYFAAAFGLKMIGHLRTQAGEEGSLSEMKSLIKQCKETPPAAITVEPQYADKAARLLQAHLQSSGITVQLVEVDPLETAPQLPGSANPDPEYYLKRMQENIDNLAKALP